MQHNATLGSEQLGAAKQNVQTEEDDGGRETEGDKNTDSRRGKTHLHHLQ